MTWGEILDAILGLLPGYVFWILAAGFIGYWYTGLIFKRQDGNPLPGFLRGGGMARFYRRPLKRALDGFDRLLAPPEYLDRADPRYCHACCCARAWNWRGYDRMLLLAVAYPVLLPILVWVFTGAAAELGAVTLLPRSVDWWDQAALGVALLAVALVLGNNRMLARHVHRATLAPLIHLWNERYPNRAAPAELGLDLVRQALIFAAFALAAAAAAALALAFVFAAAAAFAFAFAVAFAFASSLALAYVFAAAGAFAVAFALTGAFALAFSGAGAFAFAFASALAGPGAVAWLVDRRRIPTLAYATLSVAVLGAVAGIARYSPEIDQDATSLLVFLGLFPVLNAVFDHASLGLTRWSLRMSLVPARGFWGALRVAAFWALDAVGAGLLLAALILTLLASVALLNAIAPSPLVDLRDSFADMRAGRMSWVYIMVFSTLIPTLAHFALFVVGLWFRYPGAPLRRLLATYAEKGGEGDDRRFLVRLAMGGWTALLAALVILPVVHVLPNAAVWHDDALAWLIDSLEQFADARGWLGPES